MAKNLSNVHSHAESAIQGAPKKVADHAGLLERYKRFLKTEEHRIRLQHRAGITGGQISRQRAELLDIVLQNLLEQAFEKFGEHTKSKLTLVGVGGYGRGTLNPGSDIDLLFLHDHSIRSLPEPTREVIESVVRMLWDVGFKVGQSVRSVKECVQQGIADSQNLSAMIDSRFITGDKEFFEHYKERFWKGCIKGREAEYLESRRKDLSARHSKYDNTVFLQEPNVKDGPGGLRDFHTMRWIAFVKFGSHSLRRLVDNGLLTSSAYRQTRKSISFLLRVRNEMHYAERPAQDILTLRLQGTVAKNLSYPQNKVLQRIEAFMRDYYLHTRHLHHYVTSVMERLDLQAQEKKSGLVSFLALRSTKREEFDGFYSVNGLIYPQHDQILVDDSARMMRVFLHAQQRLLEMSPEIRVLLRRNFALVNVHFRYRKKIRESFEAILSRKGEVARSLRQMHRVDFLGRYLPEFGALTCLVQHEFFHRYTADEHTLKTIEMLDSLSDTEDRSLRFYRSLFHNVEDPFIIYLALILHDTGRAANVREHADASTELAGRVARRLGISVERRRLLLFLVDNHLTFWKTATTRNIEDPNVVKEFAGIVQNKAYLDALFVMTYADSKGTNQEAWSDWKESLMKQLYRSCIDYFEDSERFASRLETPSPELRDEVAARLGDPYSQEIATHFEQMPIRYFRFRGVKPICRHIKLAKKLHESANPRETFFHRWTSLEDQSCSLLEVCSLNRPELFAFTAGALAAESLNILSADIFLRKDGTVIDMFRVCTLDFAPVEEPVQRGVNRLLDQWVDGMDVPLSSLIESQRQAQLKHRSKLTDEQTDVEFPQRVWVTNDVSPDYTVVEIQAIDRIGLLFDILRAIASLDLEIAHARISTEKGAAIDTLYLGERSGGQLQDRIRLAELGHRLEDVLEIDRDD